MNEHKYGICAFQCFTQEQVKEINKKVKENIRERQPSKEAAQNVNKIGEFSIVPCVPLMELLHPWLSHCQYANKEIFGYDIYWHFHLEALNYNVYGIGSEYGWHIDANEEKDGFDGKLTCLLNLSEGSYEGGEFKLIGIDKKIKFDSGGGLIFNSLIVHKVTPVIKGERITLTYWAMGPSWR